VPVLVAGAASARTVSVTVPAATAPGIYTVLACADDTNALNESNENNNCRVSATSLVVTP
jgi:subtilase family serine protease